MQSRGWWRALCWQLFAHDLLPLSLPPQRGKAVTVDSDFELAAKLGTLGFDAVVLGPVSANEAVVYRAMDMKWGEDLHHALVAAEALARTTSVGVWVQPDPVAVSYAVQLGEKVVAIRVRSRTQSLLWLC